MHLLVPALTVQIRAGF